MTMKTLPLRVSHSTFSIVFASLLYAICNALNIDKLTKWFTQGGGVDYVGLSAYLLTGLCLFTAVFTLFAHRRTIKPVAVVLVVLSAAVTYFIAKYDVAIDSSMILNVVHTDRTEVGQLLSLRMLPYVVFLMIMPILMIVFCIDVTFVSTWRYLFASSKLFVAAVAIALVCVYSNYNAIHRAGNVSNKYIVYSLVPINVLSSGISAMSKSIKPYLRASREEIAITGRVASRDDLVVVLAIGESSRRKNFSLYGYERRNTNPVLQQIDGLHLLNGVARRGTTLYALPEILERDDVKLPTMVAKLGIPTACYVNYTMYDNCAGVGETKVSACGHGDKCYDEDVLPLLNENLKTYVSGQRFVVLHLGGGSHGPIYRDRHPPEFLQLAPTCDDADVANRCTLEQLYNSYDNTILYADHVIGAALRQLDASGVPYVFIYLSDHGESLLEEGRLFHGTPPGVSLPREQAEIPLIVKASMPISIAPRAEYRQQDVFDTVLDLFSIETTMFDRSGGFVTRTTQRIPESRSLRASINTLF
jgi:lipid A ethanolaminephosphotransferase